MSDRKPFEMRICEIRHVILKPNQPYIFTVDPNCQKCREAEQSGDYAKPTAERAAVGVDVDFTREEVDAVIDAATQRGTRNVPIECIEQMRVVLTAALSPRADSEAR